jgi:L-amino acid N-acyltransferase YncA
MSAARPTRATAAPQPVQIDDVRPEARHTLAQIIDQSFTGIYRWHAAKTLGSIDRVRAASRGDSAAGLTMFTMLEPGCGYLYYVAVRPSNRASGVGGLLLDDAIEALQAGGAHEVFACIRADNVPSVRLFASRGFVKTGFRELARDKGAGHAARLWCRMVVAPGEKLFRKTMPT